MAAEKAALSALKGIEEDLAEVDERMIALDERLARSEGASNPWMVSTAVLAVVLAIAVLGLRAGNLQLGQPPAGGEVTLAQVQALASDMRARGLAEAEIAQGLLVLGVRPELIASVVRAPAATEPPAPPAAASPSPAAPPPAAPSPTARATATPEPVGSEKVTVLEFADFQCPFCVQAHPTIARLRSEYAGRVRFVFKHFPLGFHEHAQKASEAAECARDEGKFWQMYDLLFANAEALDEASLKGYAASLGLDARIFAECLASGVKASVIDADLVEGQSRGVSGTPAFIVQGTASDGEPIEETIAGAQPYETFKDVIDMMLTGTRPTDDDPAMEILVVNDLACEACDPTRVASLLTGDQLFPHATTRTVDLYSSEGAALASSLALKVVPAYVFPRKELVASRNYGRISDALEDKGDWFVIIPGATGAGRYLEPIPAGDNPSKGPEDALVTIIEFTDFECPFCSRAQETLDVLVESYGSRVRLVFRDMPLAALHPDSPKAHEAAACARDQGRFWEMHDKFFASQSDLSVPALKRYASELGLDADEFASCLDGGAKAAAVDANVAAGRTYGVSGTPAFFINGILVAGAQPLSAFTQVIDAELKRAGAAPSATPAAAPFASPAPPAPAAPSATPAPSPLPTQAPSAPASPRQALLDSVSEVGSTAATNELVDACKAWMAAGWGAPPASQHPLGPLATLVVLPNDARLLTPAEFLAGRELAPCDCMVLLKHKGRVSDAEVIGPFAAETDCSAWSHARGCELLCYGDLEASCRAAHGCA